MEARVYVGTSGWNYKHWRNLIYPPRLAQNKWLGYTAERFDTVEVNTSFYRIPAEGTVERWQQETPPHFLFALKLWRGITHYKKLKDTGEYLANFLAVVEVLQPSRRAPLLIQLPPNQGADPGKLRAFLQEFRSRMTTPWLLAVEFRNASWLVPEVYTLLNQENVAVCLHDMVDRADTDVPNDVPFVYVRRHGTNRGRYTGSYSPEQIAADARQIQTWIDQGRSAYVYYNNDIGGHAFWNAEALKKGLSYNEIP